MSTNTTDCARCGGAHGPAWPLVVDAMASDGRLFRRGEHLCLACVLTTTDAPCTGARKGR